MLEAGLVVRGRGIPQPGCPEGSVHVCPQAGPCVLLARKEDPRTGLDV